MEKNTEFGQDVKWKNGRIEEWKIGRLDDWTRESLTGPDQSFDGHC
jgi:hypothetical protein